MHKYTLRWRCRHIWNLPGEQEKGLLQGDWELATCQRRWANAIWCRHYDYMTILSSSVVHRHKHISTYGLQEEVPSPPPLPHLAEHYCKRKPRYNPHTRPYASRGEERILHSPCFDDALKYLHKKLRFLLVGNMVNGVEVSHRHYHSLFTANYCISPLPLTTRRSRSGNNNNNKHAP